MLVPKVLIYISHLFHVNVFNCTSSFRLPTNPIHLPLLQSACSWVLPEITSDHDAHGSLQSIESLLVLPGPHALAIYAD